MTLTDILLQKD